MEWAMDKHVCKDKPTPRKQSPTSVDVGWGADINVLNEPEQCTGVAGVSKTCKLIESLQLKDWVLDVAWRCYRFQRT